MQAAEPILFPDAEAVLTSWLRGELVTHGTPLPVTTQVPEPRPDEFVRLVRTGGPRASLVTDAASITLEAWAATQDRASDVILLCRALLGAAPGRVAEVPVYLVTEFAGPAYSPDPSSGVPRYVQTFEVHLRGTAL
jgi:hypothetical protein